MFRLVILLTTILVGALRAIVRSRSDLVLENIALRQQVKALKRRRPRPQLDDADRAFWLAMRSAWRGWAARLILVQPDTVVRWHRDRSRRYWSKLSRQKLGPGRPRVDKEVRELIRRMTLENDWGAPRIHGELAKLGFTVSEATVSRHMPQRPANPDVVQRLLAFLRNHVEGIAAMDFFTLPTASLRVLYCWTGIRRPSAALPRPIHQSQTNNEERQDRKVGRTDPRSRRSMARESPPGLGATSTRRGRSSLGKGRGKDDSRDRDGSVTSA